MRILLAPTCLVVVAGGCTRINVPLNGPEVAWERRVTNHTRAAVARRFSDRPFSPGTFVGVSISGGGSRSANFSAACLMELQRHDLLQKVDVISGVSGGSITAAYYCTAADKDWNPARVQEVLTHSYASAVTVGVLMPWMWPSLALTPYSRSDLLAEEFDRVMFRRPDGRPMTFADLRPDRPQLILNATDLQSGANFTFTDELFDELNSDLSKYPVSLAVTGSSAVPVALHHTTVRDFHTTFPRYRHLVDGGIFDNLGVLSVLETYDRRVAAAAIAGQPDPYPLGAVLIVIDARSTSSYQLNSERDIGFFDSLKYGVDVSSTALLNRVSSSNLGDMVVKHTADEVLIRDVRNHIDELRSGGYVQFRDSRNRPVTVLHLSIQRVRGLDGLSDAGFGDRVSSMGTYYNINKTDADELWLAAHYLFERRFPRQIAEIRHSLESGNTPASQVSQPEGLRARADDLGLQRSANPAATRPAGSERR